MRPDLKDFVSRAIGEWRVVGDRSWNHGGAEVFEVRDAEDVSWFVKRPPEKYNFDAERNAYRRWVPALGDRAPRLRASDDGLRAMVLYAVPGKPIVDCGEMEARQAGALLRRFHDSEPLSVWRGFAAEKQARLEYWVNRGAGLLSAVEVDFARARLRDLEGVPDPPRVPCHLDYGPRNWLLADGRVSVIDFEWSATEVWVNDLAKLHFGPFHDRPELAGAFADGYGKTMTDDERELMTICHVLTMVWQLIWSHEHGNTVYEASCRERLNELRHGRPLVLSRRTGQRGHRRVPGLRADATMPGMSLSGGARALTAAASAALMLAGCTLPGASANESLPQAESKWNFDVKSEDYTGIAATDKHVFAYTDEPGGRSLEFAVLDADSGKSKWTVDPKDDATFWMDDRFVAEFSMLASKPMTVYDTETGDERFSYPETDNDVSIDSATVTSDTVVIAESERHWNPDKGKFITTVELIGLDLENGKERWREKLSDAPEYIWLDSPSPELPYDEPDDPGSDSLRLTSKSPVVYVSTGDEAGAPEETFAVDTSTGKERWRLDEPVNETDESTLEMLPDGKILGIDESEGNACSGIEMKVTDPKTDQVATVTTNESTNYGDKWKCPRVFHMPRHDELMLGQTSEHRPQLVDLTTGDIEWTAKPEANVLLYRDGIAVYEIPAGDDRGIKAVDVESGKTLWEAEPTVDDSRPPDPTFIDDENLLSSTTSDVIAAFDARTGTGRWQHPGTIAAANADHYFVRNGERLYAVPKNGGN
ncbi:MAG: PQQ-binding-like beta-propeller repeat protein [Stackebrandtia sp.]